MINKTRGEIKRKKGQESEDGVKELNRIKLCDCLSNTVCIMLISGVDKGVGVNGRA